MCTETECLDPQTVADPECLDQGLGISEGSSSFNLTIELNNLVWKGDMVEPSGSTSEQTICPATTTMA